MEEEEQYLPRSGEQYGQRVRQGRKVPFLPDHTTLKPFAYERYPLIPHTGHPTLDLTLKQIHKSFIEGDVMDYRAGHRK